MTLLNLFKPKWKHPNPEVRLKAIKKLKDQKILADIAKKDKKIKWSDFSR